MTKFISLEQAATLIKDGTTVWLSGCGGGINDPDILLSAVEKRFLQEGSPRQMVLYHSAGIGNKEGGGADRFGHEGMVRKVVGSHWTWSKKLQRMAAENKIEAYVMPQGIMTQLTRDIAAKRPGILSKTGLGTFVDPRQDGGAVNSISHEKVASLQIIEGEEYLFYRTFPIDVAICRGYAADIDGNVSFLGEGLVSEALSQAQAAYNSGGIVLCQVKKRLEYRLPPNEVTIPARLVTGVVVCPEQAFSYSIDNDNRLTGKETEREPVEELLDSSVAKNLIAKTVLDYLHDDTVVNLGFGLPALVGNLARKKNEFSNITFTLEQGIVGGIPTSGSNFGVAYYPEAFVPEPNQFDWYDGGAIDTAVLSFAEFDKDGNVNVSKFRGLVNGVGGFMNIAQNAKAVIFVGTFTTGGLQLIDNGNRVELLSEGKIHKAVCSVEQISFSGKEALKKGQSVLYVTERAVFSLQSDGLHLVSVRDGFDLKKDIFAQMDFVPVV